MRGRRDVRWWPGSAGVAGVLATVLATGLVVAAGTPATAAQRSTGRAGAPAFDQFDQAAFEAAGDAYRMAHPGDWIGLAGVYAAHGVRLLSITNPALGLHEASPAVAQRITDRRRILRIPLNAFTVAGIVGQVVRTGEYYVIGTWNFRDNYVNGSSPDDMAELSVTSRCWHVDRTHTEAYDYARHPHRDLVYRSRSDAAGNIVIGVRDRTSGFVLATDNGSVRDYLDSDGRCFARDFSAAFNYEHNQDGGSISGISFSFGILSISYSGSVSRLQKSTGIFH